MKCYFELLDIQLDGMQTPSKRGSEAVAYQGIKKQKQSIYNLTDYRYIN